MKVLDLFSGIGGFSLGLERAGMTTIAFCEIDPYARTILKKHWPDIPIHEDIKKLKGENFGSVELICGGFPCQPFSIAGQQAGEDDDRHLWPEMLRLIKETQPRWVIGENVVGFISMALDNMLSDLEGEGYEVQSFIIPACAVGGIHRRSRVWIVANAQHVRRNEPTIKRCNKPTAPNAEEGKIETLQPSGVCISRTLADSDKKRLQRPPTPRHIEIKREDAEKYSTGLCDTRYGYRSIGLPTQPSVCHRDDGLSDRLARLKVLGNSVVPQIPELIGRMIMEIENEAR